jgi:hypothetical protein
MQSSIRFCLGKAIIFRFPNGHKHLETRTRENYEALLARSANLPFKANSRHRHSGDVSEIFTLIEVDDSLIMGCATVVEDVAAVVRRRRPGVWI